jgi:tyrosyl-tRNA synthetase
VPSTGEARRQIQSGGLRVNDQAVTDPRAMIDAGAVVSGAVKLSFGKKKHALLKGV